MNATSCKNTVRDCSILWIVGFSGFSSSGVRRCVNGKSDTDVLKECSGLIFKGRNIQQWFYRLIFREKATFRQLFLFPFSDGLVGGTRHLSPLSKSTFPSDPSPDRFIWRRQQQQLQKNPELFGTELTKPRPNLGLTSSTTARVVNRFGRTWKLVSRNGHADGH